MDLNLIITEDRLKDMDLETFYNAESNPKATVDFVAHFVGDDQGRYLDKADAVSLVIKGRKLSDLAEIVTDLKEAIELQLVPKE